MESPFEYISYLLFPALEELFPGNPPGEIKVLRTISTGWESYIYVLEIAFLKSSQRLLLKIYKGELASAKAQTEGRTLEKLSTLGYPVPKVFLTDPGQGKLKLPAVLMEYLELPTLSEVLQAKPSHEYLAGMMGLQADLHRLPLPADRVEKPSPNLSQLSQAFLKRYLDFPPKVFGKTLDSILDWIEQKAREIPALPLALCHFDYHAGNLLYDEKMKDTYVLDWTGAVVSDPRFDLAWTQLLMCTYGSPDLHTPILQAYESKSGQRLEHLDFFEVVCGYKRLVHILRLVNRIEQNPSFSAGLVQAPFQQKHLHNLIDWISQRTHIDLAPLQMNLLTQISSL